MMGELQARASFSDVRRSQHDSGVRIGHRLHPLV
jgi:hypothetical protein